ncbi:hypothetical protein SAMN05421636_105286 [Pricia antarctica]|uniref:Uncharacterized protein n=1 Tax=Pricia antarctica TaxID=641691 RepID=A0A1G7DFT0_9FLAO|nr:hypothetical protein SAMN05421636_105286 [Pricia antarctica]
MILNKSGFLISKSFIKLLSKAIYYELLEASFGTEHIGF